MRRPKHRCRRAIERFLTRCLAVAFSVIVRPLSLRWIRRIGNVGGLFVYAITARRQRLADENLIAVFGERFSARERRRIRLRAAASIAKMCLELLKLPTLSPEAIRAAMSSEGMDHIRRALERGKGAIMVSAHLGNWEIAAARLAIEGVNVGVVARDASDAHVASLINHCREAVGLKVFGRDDLQAMIRHLRGNGVLAILPDQHANEAALRLDFLGRPAWCPKGPAMLALRTGCAIVPGFGVRLPDESLHGYILKEIEIPSDGDRDQNIAVLMQRINDIIGEQIRRYPDQWLWFHNRWKESPADLAKPGVDQTG
ncbi:MAG: lysophospholipid acyltransferase family protein [Candidatus Zipacnadales bacterium]